MPPPSFTSVEQRMVGRLLEAPDSSLIFEAAYLVPSGVLVGFGFSYNAPAAFAAAFAIIAFFRFWQLSNDRRALPVLREVIRKYDQACSSLSNAGDVL